MKTLQRTFLILVGALVVPACGGRSRSAPALVVAVPTGFKSYSSCDAITLHWTPVSGATGYVVYVATQAGVTPSNYGSLAGGSRVPVSVPPYVHAPVTGGTTYYFVLTAASGSVESAPAAEIFGAPSLPAVTNPPVQGSLYTLSGTLRDIVYDAVHQRAYATNETGSCLEILDVAVNGLLPVLPLGGQPWGLDLSPDSSRLFVCLRSSSEIAVVDLNANPPALLAKVPVTPDVTGASAPRNIGCAANGRAFFTCVDAGAGYSILRELNPGTLAISLRTDLNGGQLRDPTHIGVSQDRSLVVFGQGGVGGDYSYYRSSTDAFTGGGKVNTSISGVAVNADGSLFGFTPGPYIVDSSLRLRGIWAFGRNFFVFSPTNPNRGFTNIGGSICPFEIDLLTELGQIPTPATSAGRMKLDPSGSTLVAATGSGILKVPLDANTPPGLLGTSRLTVSFGDSISWTFEARDLDGDPVEYCFSNLPANAVFDPSTRRLTFTPSLAQVGVLIPSATLYCSDGFNATSSLQTFTVLNPPSYPYRMFQYNRGFGGGVTDTVYDPVRDRIYMAYSTGNRIERIQVGSNTRLAPIRCFGAAAGVDLNATATRMVVCPSNSEYVQVFDLTVEPPTLVANVPVPDGATPDQRRPNRVSVSANGHALVSTTDFTSGVSRLCDLDLSTNLITIRGDVPGGTLASRPILRASRDRSRIAVVPYNGSPASGFIYDSGSNSFGSSVALSGQVLDLDVNADGSRIVTIGGPNTVYNGAFSPLGTITGNAMRTAVRQGTTIGYRVDFFSTVEILDLTTFSTTGSFTGPNNGWFGPMITDGAGTRLFMIPQDAFAIVTLP